MAVETGLGELEEEGINSRAEKDAAVAGVQVNTKGLKWD